MANSNRGSDFNRQRKQAKRWLKALRGGDQVARERLEQVLPGHSESPGLREIQQALAREQGYESWAALKEQLTLTSIGEDEAALIDVFLEYACIFTAPADFPSKWHRAERIRARHSAVATANIHAAVVCGEVDHVRQVLNADPSAVRRKAGPQQWEPLLFGCYGRLPNERAREHSIEVAQLLLDAGADPNTHFVTDDSWKLRFNALTGVMGQGEMGQPEHPHADELARMLLERGADPNDSQGLYNTHLVGDDTRWLELLFSYGLGPESPIAWHAVPEAAVESGADKCPAILDYLLTAAATSGHTDRISMLLEHGANPDARSIYDGKSCYELALVNGREDAAMTLLRSGATETGLEGHDAFVAAVRASDRDQAARLLEGHPEFLELGAPLTAAAQQGATEVVRTLLALGLDPDAESEHGHRALHNANGNVEIAQLLLRHGADPRGRAFGGTACEWALRAGNREMARFHAEQSRSLLDAAIAGHVSLARELLEAAPHVVDERGPEGNTALHQLNADIDLAEPLLVLLLAHGANPDLRNNAGKTPGQQLEEDGADQVADLLAVMPDH